MFCLLLSGVSFPGLGFPPSTHLSSLNQSQVDPELWVCETPSALACCPRNFNHLDTQNSVPLQHGEPQALSVSPLPALPFGNCFQVGRWSGYGLILFPFSQWSVLSCDSSILKSIVSYISYVLSEGRGLNLVFVTPSCLEAEHETQFLPGCFLTPPAQNLFLSLSPAFPLSILLQKTDVSTLEHVSSSSGHSGTSAPQAGTDSAASLPSFPRLAYFHPVFFSLQPQAAPLLPVFSPVGAKQAQGNWVAGPK